jgi:glyoxylase-like metal-dependent hydrolase (beta-lactamase superfamily II)
VTSASPGVPTAAAVSPDSGLHWSEPGAWPVAEGIHRVPLPLPMDGLRAVNVYLVETDTGITMIDGGWAIDAARVQLKSALAQLGYGLRDIGEFLVTHVHRDHYTLAAMLGAEYGAPVSLGAGERPALDAIDESGSFPSDAFADALASAGAHALAAGWTAGHSGVSDPTGWRYPDRWLEGDLEISVGDRTLDAVHTPGHTPGHYVFADRAAGLLFTGDHVLPTITPSIGFTVPVPVDPLGDFMAALVKVRSLPNLRVLPAHGPVVDSSHARVDELLAFHEHRLDLILAELSAQATTAFTVAGRLLWTRHGRALDELDEFNRGMAVLETRAHLDLLVARGRASAHVTGDEGALGYVVAAVHDVG